MNANATLPMDELQRLRDQLFIARNHRAELQEQLAVSNEMLARLQERVKLSDRERAVLKNHGDGCVRAGELTTILRRVFDEAA